MTNEEVERAIDFLLRSQANSEARIEQTNEQLNRLAGTVDQLAGKVVELTEGFDLMKFQLGSYADSQAEFMRVMTTYMESASARQSRLEEAQARAEESEKRIHATLAASQERAEESQARVNESLRASQQRAEEAQARIDESLRASQRRAEESQARINESLRASIGELAAKQSKTEEVVMRLAESQVQSDRRLDALIKIVEEERGR